ncbi:recombinase family protein [Amycolatopsis sp. NPDC051045]|uniref:recombinase family protein n=1 Tax=Amycolatopsis sp. NPDC051045 TaxID=3156922 RepID=UPI00342D69EB
MYARISMDRVGAGLGVVRQLEDQCDMYERLGMSLAGVYADNDISAYSGKPRPDYLAMLDDVCAGRSRSVTAWHTDRLHRQPLELEKYIEVCEPNGITTLTVKAGHLDLSTPSGRMVARQLGAVARFESEHKSDRITAKKLEKANAGQWQGGTRPFGFEPDGESVRYEEAAEIIKATDSVLAGGSVRGVALDLMARGVLTATANTHWDSTVVRNILLRPRNAGLSVYKGEIVGKAVWPEIVPEENWRALRFVLLDPERRTNGGNNHVKWFGSGLFRCVTCGQARLRVCPIGKAGHPSYRCAVPKAKGESHVVRRAATLDNFVERLIVARLSRPDAADLLMVRGQAADTAQLHTEATAQRQRLDELSEMFAEGAITAAQLRKGSAKARERLAVLENEIISAVQVDPLAGLAGAPDAARIWFGERPDRSDGLDLGRRRAVCETLATVTILKATRGRKAGGGYFDPKSVRIDWSDRASA